MLIVFYAKDPYPLVILSCYLWMEKKRSEFAVGVIIIEWSKMKILELCCGLGGWSKGFHDIFPEAEFYGVDIKDCGYPYNFIKSDLHDWNPGQEYDIVLASPPCNQFTRLTRETGQFHYSERMGLSLVYRTFYLIEKIKPKFWVLENVEGLAEFLPPPKDIVAYNTIKRGKKAYLWGNFNPLGFFEESIDYKPNWSRGYHGRKEYAQKSKIAEATSLEERQRGEIPLALSHQMAKRMKGSWCNHA